MSPQTEIQCVHCQQLVPFSEAAAHVCPVDETSLPWFIKNVLKMELKPWHESLLEGLDKKPKGACKYGDPFCPCQDDDGCMCHYEGENPMVPHVARIWLEKTYGIKDIAAFMKAADGMEEFATLSAGYLQNQKGIETVHAYRKARGSQCPT